MRLYLSLLTFCLLAVATAQTNTVITSAKGENFTLNTKQFVIGANTPTVLSPSVLILGLRKAYASEGVKDEFLEFLKDQQYLWKYRSLRKSAEAHATVPSNQQLENQMFNFNRKIADDFFVFSTLIEVELQRKLHTYFAKPACFARDLPDEENYSLVQIALNQGIQFVVLPKELKVDSANGKYVASLSFSLADTIRNEVIDDNTVLVSGSSVESCIALLVAKVSGSLLRTIATQKEIKANGKLGSQRSAYLVANAPLELEKEIGKVLKNNDYNQDYYTSISNSEKSRFIALSVLEYEPDITPYIKMSYMNNPFPGVDMEKDIDVKRATYIGFVTLGMELNEKWYFQRAYGYFLFSESEDEAKSQFLKKIQNMDYFKNDTVLPNPEFWTSNEYEVVDSNYIMNVLPELDTTLSELQLKAEQNNLMAFAGLPYFYAQQQLYSSRMSEMKKNVNFTESYYKSLFHKTAKSDASIEEITFRYRFVQSINDNKHDYNILPVSVHLTNGSIVLRFYFWMKDEKDVLYHWTLMEDKKFPETADINKEFGYMVSDQIKTIYPWNYSFVYMMDSSFWKDYVLTKENGSYKYLDKLF